MSFFEPFMIQKEGIHALPIIHYNMEMASQVRYAIEVLKPDCIAVELPESMQATMQHAASRLPDISVVVAFNHYHDPIYYMAEPCDAAFEGLRSAAEAKIASYCIDLDVDVYPEVRELVPDPYAIQRVGLKAYYELYEKATLEKNMPISRVDKERETYMARRLKELSLSYDRILFIGGMAHVHNILKLVSSRSFPNLYHCERDIVQLCTLTPESCREVMAECGWISKLYEERREKINVEGTLDRQKAILQLYKKASEFL